MPKKAKSVTTQTPFLGQALQQNKPISKKELIAWLGCSSKYVESEVKAGKLRIHGCPAGWLGFHHPTLRHGWHQRRFKKKTRPRATLRPGRSYYAQQICPNGRRKSTRRSLRLLFLSRSPDTGIRLCHPTGAVAKRLETTFEIPSTHARLASRSPKGIGDQEIYLQDCRLLGYSQTEIPVH